MAGQIAIITAGGSGKRMSSEIPKQFLLLHGEPILMRTIRMFYQFDPTITLIVTLPHEQINYWDKLCKKHRFHLPHHIVAGGDTRHNSVRNAMTLVERGQIVAIHDGVRPLVSKALIQTCFDTAAVMGSAVPVVEITESIRKVQGKKNTSVDRSMFRLVQTPQVFRSELLIEAFNMAYNTSFTDESSLVEHTGHIIHLVKGQPENIKITTPLDMAVATAILEHFSDLL